MRTADEIIEQMRCIQLDKNVYELDGYAHLEAYDHMDGLLSGLRCGNRLLGEGNSSSQIRDYALEDVRNYRSIGDDRRDAWQMGYTAALMWCSEAFDWDEQGHVIDREGVK